MAQPMAEDTVVAKASAEFPAHVAAAGVQDAHPLLRAEERGSAPRCGRGGTKAKVLRVACAVLLVAAGAAAFARAGSAGRAPAAAETAAAPGFLSLSAAAGGAENEEDVVVLRLEAKRNNFLDSIYTAEDVVVAWYGCATGSAPWKTIKGGVDATRKVRLLLLHGEPVLPIDAHFGDPCPGREKVLLVKVKSGGAVAGQGVKKNKTGTCYKMYAGLSGVQSGYGGKALGRRVGELKNYGSLHECSLACSNNKRCRSFTVCGEWKLCSFFDLVLNVSADAEVPVVPEGHGCQQYAEVPCETPLIANTGTPATFTFKDGDWADLSPFGPERIARAWYGDRTQRRTVAPDVGAEVTDQVRRMTAGGSGGPRILVAAVVFGDKAPSKEKVLLVDLYQDHSLVNWLRSDESETWFQKGWSCHDYVGAQDHEWCRTVDREDGVEYKLAQGSGLCGICWCCSRLIRSAGDAEGSEKEAIDIFTVETRRPEGFYAVPGVPGRWMRNIGAGMVWQHGFETKGKGYLDIVERYSQTQPNKMLILADTDIAFGGCTDEELMARYHKLVDASGGAPVVVGADPWLSPFVDGMEQSLLGITRPRRADVFKAFGLREDAWKMYTPRRPPNNDYLLVNSGFIMGPAKDMRDVIRCAMERGYIGSNFNDQRGVSWCLLQRPDKITIDFTGMIVDTTFAMGQSLLDFQDMRIHNNLANVTQCYVHTDCAHCMEPFRWPEWAVDVTRKFRAVR